MKEMEKERVLQIAYKSLANGGIQAVIMGIVRELSSDFDFDVLVFSSQKKHYDEEFLKYGKIYKIPINEKKNKLFNYLEKYYRQVKIFLGVYRILKNGNYSAVHCHNEFESGICLLAARLLGVKIRITHAHNSTSSNEKNYIKKIYNNLMKPLIQSNSTIRIGCSKKAIGYVFGKKDKNAIVINNTIDLNRFNLTKHGVKVKRNSAFQFIHVGRFSYQKNQLYVLEVFKNIKDIFNGAELILVGFGPDEDIIKRKILELNLVESVIMLPHNSDIPFLYAKADYMIFPSRFEGLGIVLLEAQVMGVKCFVSDTVPPEADMGLCSFLPLDLGSEYWAEKIIDYISKNKGRTQEVTYERKLQYDIREIAQEYKVIYQGNYIL